MNALRHDNMPLKSRYGWRCAAAACLLAACGGCISDVNTQYGSRSGSYFPTSINGTDVLAEMFTEAGFEVSTRRVLVTSSMDRVQTIVWFPNDYGAPSEEACAWFDDWLASGTDRTLVYVGRGYDAEPIYYAKVFPLASKEQKRRYQRRMLARSTIRPPNIPASELDCEWFSIEAPEPSAVSSLSGPWSAGIDAAKAEVYLSDEFHSHLPSRALLSAKRTPLVTLLRDPAWDRGQLIAISNGSFLFNMPLVNHENRKLAGRLIEAVEPPGRVVFLESGPGGPPIDPPAGGSALARLFGAWPLNVILLHSAVLGIIFCFASWPIFGRPRRPQQESLSDFGKHVQAVGHLMQRTRDREYALAQLPEDFEAAKADAAGTPP